MAGKGRRARLGMGRLALGWITALTALGVLPGAHAFEARIIPGATQVKAGEALTVTIQITDAPAFAGWNAYLRFDASRFQLTSQEKVSFDTFVRDPRNDLNTAGEVASGGYGLDNGKSGSGGLVKYTFQVRSDAPLGLASFSTALLTPENPSGMAVFTIKPVAPVLPDLPQPAVEVAVVSGGTGPGSGKDADSDADGYPDELEKKAGSGPFNPNDTPFGMGVLAALDVDGAKISLNFEQQGKDTILLKGLLPIEAGFKPEGQKVILDIGGNTSTLVLDAKGRSPAKDQAGNPVKDAFRMKVKQKKGQVEVQDAKWQFKWKGGSFGDALANEGMVKSEEVKGKKVDVQVTLLMADGQKEGNMNKGFAATVPFLYSAKIPGQGTTATTGKAAYKP